MLNNSKAFIKAFENDGPNAAQSCTPAKAFDFTLKIIDRQYLKSLIEIPPKFREAKLRLHLLQKATKQSGASGVPQPPGALNAKACCCSSVRVRISGSGDAAVTLTAERLLVCKSNVANRQELVTKLPLQTPFLCLHSSFQKLHASLGCNKVQW